MSYLLSPSTKARGRVPCLNRMMAQLLFLLPYAGLALSGNTGAAQHFTASVNGSPDPRFMPRRLQATPPGLFSHGGRRLSALSSVGAQKVGDSGKENTSVKAAVGQGPVRRLDTGDVRRKHEDHRKKRDDAHERSKKASKKGDDHNDVRHKKSKEVDKQRHHDGQRESRQGKKHEGRKSGHATKKERSRKVHGKEERKVKEKKAKDKAVRTAVGRRKESDRTKERKPLKHQSSVPTEPTKESISTASAFATKPIATPAAERMRHDAADAKKAVTQPSDRKPKDHLKPETPSGPTIAFVGRPHKRAPPSRLQQDLDALCTRHFRTLCHVQQGQGPFCQVTTAIARLPADEISVDAGHDWRCYESSVAETEEMGMRCVDECGGHISCAGKLQKNHVASEQLKELSTFVDRRKWIYCSSFQYAANALCNFKKTGNVARYDPHRARWMCLDPVDLALGSTGYCADNCGGTIACAGGVIPGETPARTVYIVHSDNIVEAFAALQPCKGPNEVCVSTKLNPPRCVAAGSPGAVLKLSHQQAAMNKLCQREVDALCRQRKLNQNCFAAWLARKHGDVLACYPRAALNFGELSRCFDGCNEAPCPGAPSSPSGLRVVLPELVDIAKNTFYCSPFQAAGNRYCSTHRNPGYVARQHNVTREWQCFRNDLLPAKGWTGCANNCGSFTTCASGSLEADPTLREDYELELTIRGTPAPCLAEEECEATPLNPPYCSQTRPNPQPNVTSQDMQKELGCVASGTEKATTESRQPLYNTAQVRNLVGVQRL